MDPGLYVVGWLKRGPSGIVGTNLVDAEETAGSLVADAGRLLEGRPGGQGLAALLAGRGVRRVDWAGWSRLDEAELAAGQATGRVREKATQLADMLRLAGV